MPAGLELLDRYSDPAAVDASFARLGELWDRLLSRFQVACPDPHAERISVENPDGACSGVQSLLVDGREIEGNLVPLSPGVERVAVEVVLSGS